MRTAFGIQAGDQGFCYQPFNSFVESIFPKVASVLKEENEKIYLLFPVGACGALDRQPFTHAR
jgi:hypothetical protein